MMLLVFFSEYCESSLVILWVFTSDVLHVPVCRSHIRAAEASHSLSGDPHPSQQLHSDLPQIPGRWCSSRAHREAGGAAVCLSNTPHSLFLKPLVIGVLYFCSSVMMQQSSSVPGLQSLERLPCYQQPACQGRPCVLSVRPSVHPFVFQRGSFRYWWVEFHTPLGVPGQSAGTVWLQNGIKSLSNQMETLLVIQHFMFCSKHVVKLHIDVIHHPSEFLPIKTSCIYLNTHLYIYHLSVCDQSWNHSRRCKGTSFNQPSAMWSWERLQHLSVTPKMRISRQDTERRNG